MILYRMAKWMEERHMLRRAIRETDGDASFLIHKIDRLDEKMLAHADLWLGTNVSKPTARDDTLVPLTELPIEAEVLEALR